MGKVVIVYIMASMKGGTLYTGVTGNPAGRIWQHKNHVDPKSFTARYKVERLGLVRGARELSHSAREAY
ncbi:MAG: GIY-YIG nuclease family protein [Devosia sp.]